MEQYINFMEGSQFIYNHPYMIHLKLTGFYHVQHLFVLLNLPGSDFDLEKEYQNLMKVVSEKERAVESLKYDLAGNKRQEEKDSINRIIDLLNAKGILQKNILKVTVDKFDDTYDHEKFEKKVFGKARLKPEDFHF